LYHDIAILSGRDKHPEKGAAFLGLRLDGHSRAKSPPGAFEGNCQMDRQLLSSNLPIVSEAVIPALSR
jgi:hypothetical protein